VHNATAWKVGAARGLRDYVLHGALIVSSSGLTHTIHLPYSVPLSKRRFVHIPIGKNWRYFVYLYLCLLHNKLKLTFIVSKSNQNEGFAKQSLSGHRGTALRGNLMNQSNSSRLPTLAEFQRDGKILLLCV